MDIWSKMKRSEVMSNIRSTNTKPEIIIRSLLFRNGYRFRIHQKTLPGKPDIVFAKYRTVIFVHGCFWHNHSKCKEGRIPSSNSVFWKEKLKKNINRDKVNISKLKDLGWKVIVVWECEIDKQLDRTINKIIKVLTLQF